MTDTTNPTVLVVCSGEDGDEELLATAADLAQDWHADVAVLAALEPPSEIGRIAHAAGVSADDIAGRLAADCRDKVAGLVARTAPDLRATIDVRLGKPFIEIIRQVIARDVDLVLKTAEELTGIHHHLFASTDQHLLRKCPCPVWLRWRGSPRSVKTVLAAVDVDEATVSEPETLADKRVCQHDTRIFAFHRTQTRRHAEPVQIDIRGRRRVGARLIAKHTHIVGDHHGDIGGQQRDALGLCVEEPLGARLIRARVARMFDKKDQRIFVVVDRTKLHACRFQHVGIDRIDARGEALRLAGFQFRLDIVDHRIAERLGQEMRALQARNADHGGIEIVTRRLEMIGALLRIVRNLRFAVDDLAVAHGVHHGKEPRHGMGQRFLRMAREIERLHRRERGKIRTVR